MATNYYQDPFGAPDYSAEGMPSLLSLSNLESLGRGSVAGLLDLPYFFEGMLMGDQDPRMPQRRRVVPSSEQVLATTPRMTQPTPQAGLLETAGAFMSPAPVAAVKPVAKAVGRGGKAVARMAGQEITDVMSGMPSRSLLGDITPQPKLLDVYHGTPHTLPPTERNPLGEFDASKIGTGEGAQTFGYGIYTAENPAVAKDYQFMEQNWFDTSKAKYKGKSIDTWYEQAQKDQERAFKTNNKALEKDATARLAYWENIMTHNHPESVLKQFTDPEYGWDAATNYAKSIDINKFEGIPTPGNLYKVDLPDEKIATMLDWDKPLIDQNQNVLNAAKKLGFAYTKPQKLSYEDKWALFDKNGLYDVKNPTFKTKKEAQDFLKTNKTLYPDMTGAEFHDSISTKLNQFGGNDKKTAEFLNSYGISGIKYLDQFSREAGEGTRNFVTFPGQEKSMTILERNGMRGLLD